MQAVENLKPISATDHSRGNPAAPLKMVEYSDLQCPFCKLFHQSMLSLYPEYIDGGKVFWVYRHFPLVTIHENAQGLAIASECAFKQKGEEGFWKIVNGVFGDTAQKYDMTKLPTLAKDSGLNVSKFVKCAANKETASIVDSDALDAAKMGINGTPYAVIIAPSGKTFPINQAYSPNDLRAIFDALATQ